MCYSNSSTSSNVELAKKYKKELPIFVEPSPVYFASGFSFPDWRIITAGTAITRAEWGLIPFWHTGNDLSSFRTNTLNARIETIQEKPSFRESFSRRRCIVPSNGFFEWQSNGKSKDPFFIYLPDQQVLSMAGIFDVWKNPQTGKEYCSFALLTCTANLLMSEIHNSKKRMPILLADEQLNSWLHHSIPTHELLFPSKNEELVAHPIDKTLIREKQNKPEIQFPYEPPFGKQFSLFD